MLVLVGHYLGTVNANNKNIHLILQSLFECHEIKEHFKYEDLFEWCLANCYYTHNFYFVSNVARIL